MQRDTKSAKFPIGSPIPEFSLPATDGRDLGTQYLRTGKASLVVFSCNHCPYVKGSDHMLIEVVKRFEPLGLKSVVISSNDAAQYPEDSFELMKEKSSVLKLPYPYLYDETQSVARSFDAACTPECFLFDAAGKLCYQGALTDRPKEKEAARADLLSPAIEAELQGRKPEPNFNHPIGCSIKWR